MNAIPNFNLPDINISYVSAHVKGSKVLLDGYPRSNDNPSKPPYEGFLYTNSGTI